MRSACWGERRRTISSSRGGSGLSRFSGVYPACVPLAKEDPTRSPEGRNEVAEADAHRAVELLGEAIRKGWKDVEHIKSNPDFDPLRSREDYRRLLAELEGKLPTQTDLQP